MADADVSRAAERARLACRALAAAAKDLHVAQKRDEAIVADAAHALEAEHERVCELAEELSGLAQRLATLTPA
jgi:hypothetical protein